MAHLWRNSIVATIVLLLVLCGVHADAAQWQSLFDGKTLDGWYVRGGTAKYHVEDAAIVGTTVEGSPNTFLCTENDYGDFVLEFEVKCDAALNSGGIENPSGQRFQTVLFCFGGGAQEDNSHQPQYP